ncbi:MAG: hypothetical protein H6709_09005 [Kofleriaceae bacterium]|nr:hypothetical protein [Kofleriaceae bacterium]
MALAVPGLVACASGQAGDPDATVGDRPDATVSIDAPSIDASPIDAMPIDGAAIDAMPIDGAAIDAMPIDGLPIDAMPIDGLPIDANCTVQTVQLLTNPSFDASPQGTGWVQVPFDAAYPLIDVPAVTADTTPYSVWMGGFLSATDSLYQTVAIPAGATGLNLRGKRWIGTEETGTSAFDTVRLQIRSSAGALLEQLVQWSNVDNGTAWTSFVLTPTGNYAGQTIRVYAESSTDSTLNTNFFFDTWVLEATVCQ